LKIGSVCQGALPGYKDQIFQRSIPAANDFMIGAALTD
jgi:hypothetical protein